MPNIALLALEASDGTVVLTSIVLVFAMLIALCLIITIEGKIFDSINHKAAKPQPPVAKAADGAIPGEVIAAISAAVACVMGEGAVIHGIRRVTKSGKGSRRGAWGDAGVREHTTPFM